MSNNESIKLLSDNVSRFFDQFEEKYSQDMKCKVGCSACCYTDLSVFTIEAERISHWFSSLDESTQKSLKKLWKAPVKPGACAFLYDDRCTVYEVRPIICRSHGALIKFKDEDQDVFDICPLNEAVNNDEAKAHALDLDRLNTLLSLAQGQFDGSGKRVSLKEVKKSF